MQNLRLGIFEPHLSEISMRGKALKIVVEMIKKTQPKNLEELKSQPEGGIQNSLENLLKENAKKKRKNTCKESSSVEAEIEQMPNFDNLFSDFEELFANFDWLNFNEEKFEKKMTPYLKKLEKSLNEEILESLNLEALSEQSAQFLQQSIEDTTSPRMNEVIEEKDANEDMSLSDLKMLRKLLEKTDENLFYVEILADEMATLVDSLKNCEPGNIRQRVHFTHFLDRLERFSNEKAPICPLSETELKAIQAAKKEHQNLPFDF